MNNSFTSAVPSLNTSTENEHRPIIIAAGSFHGKSLVALNLANKYNYSGVLTTDMCRNFLKIQSLDVKHLSTSTYKLSPDLFNKQKETVSYIVEQELKIYKERGENIIIEGMHYSNEFIRNISKRNYLKIFLNNTRSLQERILLKRITRYKFSFEGETDYSGITKNNFKKSSYNIYQDRIDEIHEELKAVCISNGFIEINFAELNVAKMKCESLVEKYLLS